MAALRRRRSQIGLRLESQAICRRIRPGPLHHSCTTTQGHSHVLTGTERHNISAGQGADLHVSVALTRRKVGGSSPSA